MKPISTFILIFVEGITHSVPTFLLFPFFNRFGFLIIFAFDSSTQFVTLVFVLLDLWASKNLSVQDRQRFK